MFERVHYLNMTKFSGILNFSIFGFFLLNLVDA